MFNEATGRNMVGHGVRTARVTGAARPADTPVTVPKPNGLSWSGDLMRPFRAEPMQMWPISTRVNKPENDDPSIVEPLASARDVRTQPLQSHR